MIDDLRVIYQSDKLKFITLEQIRRILDYKPSLSTIAKMLKRAKISRRRFTNHVRIRGQVDQERIDKFKSDFVALDFESIVCIDETGFSNVGNSYYGYFRKGVQPESFITKKKLRKSSVVAISSNTIVHHKIQDKAYNSITFVEFFKELVLVPSSVSTILMDNIAFHKSLEIKQLAEKHNLKLLFIPPYMPKYDPIEEFFAQVKRVFRTLLLDNIDFHTAIDLSLNHIRQQNHVFLGSYMHTLQFCKL